MKSDKQSTCCDCCYGSESSIEKKQVNNGKAMVIVVDMINGFCVSGALADKRCFSVCAEIEKTLTLLDKAEKVFLCDSHTLTSTEFQSYPVHCMGDVESEIIEPLKKFNGRVINKNSTNGFFALSKSVELKSYDNFVIVGVCSDICVLQLALSLRAYFTENNESNKNVIVLSECIETFSTPMHDGDYFNNAAVQLMANAGIQIFKNVTE